MPRHLTTLPGDERWPSWTSDGRVVFSHRAVRPLAALCRRRVGRRAEAALPRHGRRRRAAGARVADGKRVAYVSDRESDDGDHDLWVADLAPGPRDRVTRLEAGARPRHRRVSRVVAGRVAARVLRGARGHGRRLGDWRSRRTCAAARAAGLPARRRSGATAARRRGRHAGVASRRGAGLVARRPAACDRQPAAARPDLQRQSGAQHRRAAAALCRRRSLPLVARRRPAARSTPASARLSPRRPETASSSWRSIASGRRCGVSTIPRGHRPPRWQELRAQYRPQAQAAQDEAALESAIDAMVAEQPLIKPLVVSDRAVVVSGHPLASRAGALALEKGGNIVDAAIAVSFALGVVEPDASGHRRRRHGAPLPQGDDRAGRDRLQGSGADPRDARQPAARRQAPATAPAAANIPGVVAGLDLLYRNYGSKQDPVGRPRRAGDRLRRERIRARRGAADDDRRGPEVLPEVPRRPRASTCRTARCRRRAIASSTRTTPRRCGRSPRTARMRSTAASIARRIADDMAKNGGLITVDDLAQYRAIERRPLAGRYRDHHDLLGAAAGVDGGRAHRNAADSRQLPAEAGADVRQRRRLPALRRSSRGGCATRGRGSPIPALWDVSLGPHLDPAHAADALQADRPEEGLARSQRGRRPKARPSGSAAGRRRLRSRTPKAT